ncbi:TetR family transcriptional regulator [Intrasporangium oryzae NRRL B-24470]|uniref:TetR family transcriptional regulator n=1 Tax=Intrasporangium oryzae NRRL B-24470 TaxID=1386089 RepID=W9G6K6_9MICO|nr:TetR/AcrR family transcriptional regulator [Intrasporangium oryzae]EWT01640.1 TetR family transcriptional regulator [Intrasporangium oryzae NRRL B-24470]
MDDTTRDDSRRGSPAPRVAPARDGRDARWEQHRSERRAAIVDATIRAVRRHGAAVGMDDIAAEAGTSKTVVYRHFDDKAGLYRAVAARIDQRVVGDVGDAMARARASDDDLRHLIASTVEAYLSLVESDTEVYRFVVNRPLVDQPLPDDPVGGTVGEVTDRLTRLLEQSLRGTEVDSGRARLWAVALVGSVRAVADDWLASPDRRPREELVELLTELAWRGLSPWVGDAP